MTTTDRDTTAGARPDLAVGAADIAQECFDGKLNPRQVYRLAQDPSWPFFKLANKLALRPSDARAKMTRDASRAATATDVEQVA